MIKLPAADETNKNNIGERNETNIEKNPKITGLLKDGRILSSAVRGGKRVRPQSDVLLTNRVDNNKISVQTRPLCGGECGREKLKT